MADQKRVNWTISEAAYGHASEMAERYGSLSKVVEIAIDRMYREEYMSSIAAKAGISAQDDKATIASKLRTWIVAKAPDLTEAQVADQALLAWNGIHATWGRNADGFSESWGEGAGPALKRQVERWK